MKFSPQAARVFKEYQERDKTEIELMQTLGPSSGMSRRDEFLLPIGEETGQFLHSLIVSSGAKTILELGTSYGYSTLIMADAARLSGGKVITLEKAAAKQESAKDSLSRAGLDQYVEWHQGDALEILASLDESFDIVLLDIWKELYIPCLELFYPKLAPGALVAADNILLPPMHRQDMQAYQAKVRNLPGIINSSTLDIGSGIELSCYSP